MKMVKIQLSQFATLTGYLHEFHPQLSHIKKFPAIICVPGGGFRFCSFTEGEPIAMSYYAKGFQAFVLEYTTVTTKPDATIEDPMNDAQRAIAHIRESAEEYCVEAGKLAMIGFSGGAHLASAVSTHGPLRPDLLLLGYPGIIHSDLRALDCPDIIESVTEETPSTFIFVTRNDPVTPPKHALAFANALDQCGVDFEMHIFRNGTHGMALGTEFTSGGYQIGVNPRFAQWFELSVSWIFEQWGAFPTEDIMPSW